MDEEILQSRLSRISTMWSLLARSQQSPPGTADDRWAALLERYQGVVYRYLLGSLRDPDAADELFQEFALRCLQGAFRGADPQRGRFRDYLKSALFHLIVDQQQNRRKRLLSLELDGIQPAASPEGPTEAEQRFVSSWRDDVLSRAWAKLAEAERRGGQPYYSVLKYRAENPAASSAMMAAQLTELLRPERPLTETGIRKTLQRARAEFADALIADVQASLENPTNDDLAEELDELGLLPYCRSALARGLGSR
jgi:RNA polymerase sigma factor (sigma-70 family)